MTMPSLKSSAIAAGAVAIVLALTYGLGYRAGQAKVSQRAETAENEANVARGERETYKRQAEAKDQEIAARDAGLDAARNNLRRAEQELARSKMERPPVVPVPLPAIPGTPVGDLGVEGGWRDLVGRQEAVIQAQAYYINGLETKISDLTISRDAWKASAQAGEREAAGLRIALEAQKSLTKGALWKGRIQGLAIGLGSGYVLGRAQR